MPEKFLKDPRTGFVINMNGDYQNYLQKKKEVKSLVQTKRELNETKQELSNIKSELSEVKGLLEQLLRNKET